MTDSLRMDKKLRLLFNFSPVADAVPTFCPVDNDNIYHFPRKHFSAYFKLTLLHLINLKSNITQKNIGLLTTQVFLG